MGEDGEQRGGEVLGDLVVCGRREQHSGELVERGGPGGGAQQLFDDGVGEQQLARADAVAARELGGGGVGVLVAAPESVEHVAGERIGVELASRCQVRADRSLHRGVDEGGGDEQGAAALACGGEGDRKSTRLNSSHVAYSYAVFFLY